jgi:hypothetical protein
MIDLEEDRKALHRAERDKQLVAEIQTTVQRASKIIKKSRREIQRSRDLITGQKEPRTKPER